MSFNQINLVIPGTPKAKQRSRRGAFGNWYNPQEKEMNALKFIIRDQLPVDFVILEKNIPVVANINFFFEPVRNEETKNFLDLIINDNYPYIKKPDIDNCIKYVMDVLSKIVFYDDNQIYSGVFNKYYSLNPRTEIEILWQKNKQN